MDDLIVSTLQAYSPILADNVLKNNVFLSKLKEKNKIKLLDGGDFIEENLMYAENSTFKWYSGYELLEVTGNPVLTSAKFQWKQANANVVISGEEKRKNKGSKTRKYDLIESRITVAEKTMKNKISESIFSDGTGYNGKELTGLQAIVSDNPSTGVVGGIDRAQHAFWRNQMYSLNAEQGIAGGTQPTGAQLLEAFDQMLLRTTRGADRPTMIICDMNYYSIYKSYLQSIKRIVGGTKADGGFTSIDFDEIPVYYDVNVAPNHAYFLNLDYLSFKAHEDANFSVDKERLPYNQDAGVYPLLFMGNLTVSNCNLQGVVKA
jgi:hypothetical protein